MSARLLKLDNNFVPAEVHEGDELFRNGIFTFNVTKMLGLIKSHPEDFIPEHIAVSDFIKDYSSINEDYMDSVTIEEPVLLAEIAPGRYNLIDGNHRMEKARRSGIEHVMAYRLRMEQHIQFLTTQEAHAVYVQYWNGKVRDLEDTKE